MPPWPERFASTPADRRALLALSALRSTPARRLQELALEHRTAARCLRAVTHERAIPGAEAGRAREADVDAIVAAVRACGARMIVPSDPEYPPSLEDLADPPAWLFVRGRKLHELYPRVAMVGARNCSETGRDIANEMGRGLAQAGICVVSGGALGIDSASHVGALAAGGPTIAVLGCGIDRTYPASNRKLMARIEEAGAVVSEYPPGVSPDAFRFPARNRIVAALAEAVVVVEGATGSGSLITADHALDLGRPISAIPGAVTNPLAAVPLALIRDGATLVRGSEDLLSDLGRIDARPDADRVAAGLSVAHQTVLARLTGPTLAEHVARDLQWDLSDVVAALVDLEIRGLVRSIGGRFEPRLGASR
ncbi:MAG: DNA-processing protein DprA [Actinomycetota bacterium]